MSESRRTADRIPDLARRTSVVTGASSDLGLATAGHAARRGAHAVASTRLTIDVWADVLCPWCYIGEQRLSTAIEQSAHVDDIDVKIHTFQLDPAATTQVTPTLQCLSERYGVSAAQARTIEEGAAVALGARGVPFTVLGNRLGIPGAVSAGRPAASGRNRLHPARVK